MQVIIRSLLILSIALLGAAALAVLPQLVVPRTMQPPTLDGVFSPGEWEDAAASTGLINQFARVAHPRQAIFWVKYDQTYIYIACKSTCFPEEQNPGVQQTWLDRDSSMVVGINPARKGRGTTPSHFLLRVNINKQLLSREIFWELEGVKISYPHPEWTSGVQVEQKIENNSWICEMRIPLTNLQAADMKDGEEWGLLLGRDYSAADQCALTLSSDWRFGDGNRHYGRAFYNNYRLEQEYGRVRMSGKAPAVQLLDLGDVLNGRPTPVVVVKNITDTPLRVLLRAQYNLKSNIVQKYALELQPGERKSYTFETVKLPSGKTTVCVITVSTPESVLLAQEIPLKPGWGRERTISIPEPYFGGQHFGEKETYNVPLFATGYDPISNEFYGRVRVSDLPAAAQATRAELTIRRQRDDRVVATLPIKGTGPLLARGNEPRATATATVSSAYGGTVYLPNKEEQSSTWLAVGKLPSLQPGVYEATASIYNKEEKVIGCARQTFIRYDHRKDLPWLFEKVGASSKVLPPWTPIKAKQENSALVLDCWGRTYRIGADGLLKSIINQGAVQLAAPVSLRVVKNNHPALLTAGKTLANIKCDDHEASYTGQQHGANLRITTTGRLEYDGYLQHTIRIAPLHAAARVDALQVIISLHGVEATHLHAAGGEWFRNSVVSIALKPGEGQLWNSSQSYGSATEPSPVPFGKKQRAWDLADMTVGNFRPYVWIGNAERGLAFMADNDQGWVPDDSGNTPAIEVVRKNDVVQLVLNLVARPFTFSKAREITFSLQATPIRSLPDDFRARRNYLNMATAFPGAYDNKSGWAWTGQMYEIKDNVDPSKKTWLFGLPGSAPYPLNWDISAWYRKACEEKTFHSDFCIYTPYQSELNIMTFPEVNDSRMPPGKQVGDVYGYIYPHMSQGHLEHGNGSMAEVDVDYRLWCYRNWIKYVGLKGMYFDQTEPVLTANPEAGFGYVLDLPDRPALHGKIQPGYGLTRVRDFYKRLRTLFVASRVEDPYIWLHTTDANMVSAFAFAGYLLEGENEPRVNKELPISVKIPPTRMQAMKSSAGGLALTQLEMIDGNSWNDPLVWRDVSGWFMLHDTGQGGSGGMRQYNYAGLDLTRKADFLPYWLPRIANALQTSRPDIYASAWRQDNTLRVLIYNRNATTLPATVRLDLAALGLSTMAGKPFTATELEPTAKPEVRGAGELQVMVQGNILTVTVPVLPWNFRLFKVE